MDTPQLTLRSRYIALAAASGACAVSLVLLWQSGDLPGCGGGSPCAELAAGRWSRWGGIPVAGVGAAAYIAMAGLLGVLGRSRSIPRFVWPVLITLALSAGGAIAWFILLQVAVVGRVCPYCMIAHGLGIVACTIILHAAGKAGWQRRRGLWGGAALAVATLILGQVLIEPKLYSVTDTDDRPTSRPAIGPRTVSALGGRVALDIRDYPLLGSPDAPHVLIDLFDYTCPNCRHMHRLLEEVRRRHPQVAVLLVPVPLDGRCNPDAKTTEPDHANACLYARYALAVWRANPARFDEYHHWLLAGEKPPAIEAARQKAESLVGASALADPAADQTIAQGVALHRTLGGVIPKLLLPNAAITGRVETASQLAGILEKYLKLGHAAENPPRP